jgi:hypothetical protein
MLLVLCPVVVCHPTTISLCSDVVYEVALLQETSQRLYDLELTAAITQF